MPHLALHLRCHGKEQPDDFGMTFRDLDHAYLEECRAIPDIARDMLAEGRDPMACAYVIYDNGGRRLIEVPFDDLLLPAELRLRRARRGTRFRTARRSDE